MPVTTTAKETYLKALNSAEPQKLADVLAAIDLGDILTVQEWDSGTITAAATITLPGGALLVQSIRVVTSGTAGSVGSYLPSDANAVMIVPPGGASVAVGVARVAADGSTITLPNTVTRVVVRYIKKPAVDLTANFNRS